MITHTLLLKVSYLWDLGEFKKILGGGVEVWTRKSRLIESLESVQKTNREYTKMLRLISPDTDKQSRNYRATNIKWQMMCQEIMTLKTATWTGRAVVYICFITRMLYSVLLWGCRKPTLSHSHPAPFLGSPLSTQTCLIFLVRHSRPSRCQASSCPFRFTSCPSLLQTLCKEVSKCIKDFNTSWPYSDDLMFLERSLSPSSKVNSSDAFMISWNRPTAKAEFPFCVSPEDQL